ncbi:MAG: hypothetical protein J6W03_06615 [Bacteroidaceae bacterium]|nr:hypothetical protein [Bacteroidaceae bacterium]
MKKVILLLLTLPLLLPLWGEERVWCLITDGGECVAMGDVLCLAAADDDSTFAVVLTSGVTIGGVRRAHFDIEIPTGVTKPGIVVAKDILHLTNAPAGSNVSIYSIDGRLMKHAKSDEAIDVSTLPDHTYYIIKLGETAFKFRKP